MSFKTGDVRTDFQASCPFNPAHKMPESKLFFHITKGCKDKEAKAHLFDICPYNSLHYIRKELLDQHLVHCKSKPEDYDKIQQELKEAVQQQFKNQKPQNLQQQQISIPGLVLQEEKKPKKKRIRHKKQKEDNKDEENEDDMPSWNNNNYEDTVQVDKEIEEQISQEKIDIQDDLPVKVESKVQEEIDDWDEVETKKQSKKKKKNQRKQKNSSDDEVEKESSNYVIEKKEQSQQQSQQQVQVKVNKYQQVQLSNVEVSKESIQLEKKVADPMSKNNSSIDAPNISNINSQKQERQEQDDNEWNEVDGGSRRRGQRRNNNNEESNQSRGNQNRRKYK